MGARRGLESELDALLKPRAEGAGPRIVVNDMSDGVLMFEDEDEARRCVPKKSKTFHRNLVTCSLSECSSYSAEELGDAC